MLILQRKVLIRVAITITHLAVSHELGQGVVDEVLGGSLHLGEGDVECGADGVQDGDLTRGGEVEYHPAQGLGQRRELALRDGLDQAVLYIACNITTGNCNDYYLHPRSDKHTFREWGNERIREMSGMQPMCRITAC